MQRHIFKHDEKSNNVLPKEFYTDVTYDNNMSERDLRFYKRKTRILGGFRNVEATKHYANALTIIKTSIKRNINSIDSINAISSNEILFA